MNSGRLPFVNFSIFKNNIAVIYLGYTNFCFKALEIASCEEFTWSFS